MSSELHCQTIFDEVPLPNQEVNQINIICRESPSMQISVHLLTTFLIAPWIALGGAIVFIQQTAALLIRCEPSLPPPSGNWTHHRHFQQRLLMGLRPE